MSDTPRFTRADLIARLRALSQHRNPSLLAGGHNAVWRNVCREAAEMLEHQHREMDVLPETLRPPFGCGS